MMLTILEMPTYVEDADKLLTTQEHEDLKSLLASNPEVGDLIPRAGGIRKVRWTQEKAAKGKRGGARVVYYYHNEKYPLALIAIYGKSEKIDLSEDEKKELKNLAKSYVEGFMKKIKPKAAV